MGGPLSPIAALLFLPLLLAAGTGPAMACKSAGSFFDYRNCLPPQPPIRQAVRPQLPTTTAPPASREVAAVLPGPARMANPPARPAREPVSIPFNVVPERPDDAAPPTRPQGERATRLVDFSDGAGRKLTMGCVAGEAVLYVEFATRMSDQGYKKEVYFTIDGGEAQILELEMSRRESVMGVWQGYRAAPLVSRMLEARNLALEATSAEGQDLLMSFRMELAEGDRAILKRACPV